MSDLDSNPGVKAEASVVESLVLKTINEKKRLNNLNNSIENKISNEIREVIVKFFNGDNELPKEKNPLLEKEGFHLMKTGNEVLVYNDLSKNILVHIPLEPEKEDWDYFNHKMHNFEKGICNHNGIVAINDSELEELLQDGWENEEDIKNIEVNGIIYTREFVFENEIKWGNKRLSEHISFRTNSKMTDKDEKMLFSVIRFGKIVRSNSANMINGVIYSD